MKPKDAGAKPPSFRPAVVSRDDALFAQSLTLFGAAGAMFVAWVLSVQPAVFTVEDIRPEQIEDLAFTRIPVPVVALESPSATVEAAPAASLAARPGKGEHGGARRPRPRPEDSPLLRVRFPTTRGEGSGSAPPPDDLDIVRQSLGEADVARPEAGPSLRGASPVGREEGIADPGRIGGGSVRLDDVDVIVVERPTLAVELGQADAAAVSAVVDRKRGDLLYCHERDLLQRPDVQGRIELEWVVRKGRVTGVEVVSDTTGSDTLGECIAGRIARWSFPPSVDTEVAWPFVFRPRGGR